MAAVSFNFKLSDGKYQVESNPPGMRATVSPRDLADFFYDLGMGDMGDSASEAIDVLTEYPKWVRGKIARDAEHEAEILGAVKSTKKPVEKVNSSEKSYEKS